MVRSCSFRLFFLADQCRQDARLSRRSVGGQQLGWPWEPILGLPVPGIRCKDSELADSFEERYDQFVPPQLGSYPLQSRESWNMDLSLPHGAAHSHWPNHGIQSLAR